MHRVVYEDQPARLWQDQLKLCGLTQLRLGRGIEAVAADGTNAAAIARIAVEDFAITPAPGRNGRDNAHGSQRPRRIELTTHRSASRQSIDPEKACALANSRCAIAIRRDGFGVGMKPAHHPLRTVRMRSRAGATGRAGGAKAGKVGNRYDRIHWSLRTRFGQ